jgi:hypothetical protein
VIAFKLLQKVWALTFIHLISKTDCDKPKLKNINDPLQFERCKTHKVLVILQCTKNKIKKKQIAVKKTWEKGKKPKLKKNRKQNDFLKKVKTWNKH